MRFNKTGEIAAVLLNASKTFKVGMHLHICELIRRKLGVMIDAIELYMLILV